MTNSGGTPPPSVGKEDSRTTTFSDCQSTKPALNHCRVAAQVATSATPRQRQRPQHHTHRGALICFFFPVLFSGGSLMTGVHLSIHSGYCWLQLPQTQVLVGHQVMKGTGQFHHSKIQANTRKNSKSAQDIQPEHKVH